MEQNVYNAALEKYIDQHYRKKDGIRLGQRFVNDYIKGRWPELFYCNDDAASECMIRKYLYDLCYFDTMPDRRFSV